MVPVSGIAGWTEAVFRRDAMQVIQLADGGWAILPPDERPMVNYCHCCGTRFETASAAKFAANSIYPEKRADQRMNSDRTPQQTAATTNQTT